MFSYRVYRHLRIRVLLLWVSLVGFLGISNTSIPFVVITVGFFLRLLSLVCLHFYLWVLFECCTVFSSLLSFISYFVYTKFSFLFAYFGSMRGCIVLFSSFCTPKFSFAVIGIPLRGFLWLFELTLSFSPLDLFANSHVDPKFIRLT